jgi:EpsI family protein
LPAHTPVICAIAVLTATAAAYAPLWPLAHAQWTTVSTYEHGYLLLAMACWMGWARWESRPPAVAPGWPWLLPCLVLTLLSVALELLFLNVPRLYVIPLWVTSAVGLVFGTSAALRLMPAAILLYGALPVWASINGVLQSLTVTVVSWALARTGVTAFVDGNLVQLPSGSFEIAEACSGLRYAVIGITLAYLFAFGFLRDAKARILLIAGAAISMLVGNWLRVYIVIYAGYVTDMQHYLVTVEHIRFGWLMFALSMLPVFLAARVLAEKGRRGLQGPRADGDVSAQLRPPVSGARVMSAATLSVLVLLALPILARTSAGERTPAAGSVAGAPTRPQGASWQPVFIGSSEQFFSWDRMEPRVEEYRALYARQSPERRLIRYENTFTGADWLAIGQRTVRVQANGESFHVVEYEGISARQRRIVWAWYRVAGVPATRPVVAKMLELRGLLAGRRDAAAVALSAQCAGECDSARAALGTAIREAYENLQ